MILFLNYQRIVQLKLASTSFKIIICIYELKCETQKDLIEQTGESLQNTNKNVLKLTNLGILEITKVIGRTKFLNISKEYIINMEA